jgi:hypothetical protein
LHEIELIVAQWCLKLTKIGTALSKENVIGLATEMIKGNGYAEKLRDFKKKQQLLETTEENEEKLLGTSWYKGFME